MSEVWGTVYQMERDKAMRQDTDSLRQELSATKSVLAATREHVQRLEVENAELKKQRDAENDTLISALRAAERAIDDCQNYRSHLHHKELAQVRSAITAMTREGMAT